jgi:hypothetical protein
MIDTVDGWMKCDDDKVSSLTSEAKMMGGKNASRHGLAPDPEATLVFLRRMKA